MDTSAPSDERAALRDAALRGLCAMQRRLDEDLKRQQALVAQREPLREPLRDTNIAPEDQERFFDYVDDLGDAGFAIPEAYAGRAHRGSRGQISAGGLLARIRKVLHFLDVTHHLTCG